VTVLQVGQCGVQFTAGARTFSLFLNVQTGCGIHPACYSVDDERKQPGHDADRWPSSGAEMKNEWKYYLPPLNVLMASTGTLYL
jgi:hypothetical protein